MKKESKYLVRCINKELHEEVTAFSLLEKGACNDIYLFKTNSEKLYCLKVERQDKLDKEKNDIFTEAKLINFLYNKAIIHTPKVFFISKKYKIYCYEYIDGETFDSKNNSMTKKEMTLLMKSIGKYHAELYNKAPATEVGLIGIKSDKYEFEDYISDILSKLSKISTDSELYRATLIMKQLYKKCVFKAPINGLLHGDLHEGNMLVNRNKLVGVLDFGKSIIGDIHGDFSHHMRNYPEHIDTIIESFESETKVRLSKNKIIFYAFLKDMEKLIYHVDKYNVHSKRMEKKINLYKNLLKN